MLWYVWVWCCSVCVLFCCFVWMCYVLCCMVVYVCLCVVCVVSWLLCILVVWLYKYMFIYIVLCFEYVFVFVYVYFLLCLHCLRLCCYWLHINICMYVLLLYDVCAMDGCCDGCVANTYIYILKCKRLCSDVVDCVDVYAFCALFHCVVFYKYICVLIWVDVVTDISVHNYINKMYCWYILIIILCLIYMLC